MIISITTILAKTSRQIICLRHQIYHINLTNGKGSSLILNLIHLLSIENCPVSYLKLYPLQENPCLQSWKTTPLKSVGIRLPFPQGRKRLSSRSTWVRTCPWGGRTQGTWFRSTVWVFRTLKFAKCSLLCSGVIAVLAAWSRLGLSRHQFNSAGFWIQVPFESQSQGQVSSPPLLHVSSRVDKITSLSCFETNETSWWQPTWYVKQGRILLIVIIPVLFDLLPRRQHLQGRAQPFHGQHMERLGPDSLQWKSPYSTSLISLT